MQIFELHISYQMRPCNSFKTFWGLGYTCLIDIQALDNFHEAGP